MLMLASVEVEVGDVGVRTHAELLKVEMGDKNRGEILKLPSVSIFLCFDVFPVLKLKLVMLASVEVEIDDVGISWS